MEYLSKFTDVIEGRLFWLWAILAASFIICLGLLISWTCGKPVVKFFIDGDCKMVMPSARGEKIQVPIEMTEYFWFVDKEMKTPLSKEFVVEKRVVNIYSSKNKIMGGIEN